jgi:glycosyltransferase involved in cell wall biosynthesis
VSAAGQSYLFVITAYNARPYLGALAASLAFQRCKTWKAVFVDDCSSDGTHDEWRYLLDAHRIGDRCETIQNDERRYKAANVYAALEGRGSPDDVVVLLDGDDHLAVDHALDRLTSEYDQGWEVVWSNWRGSDGSRGTSTHLHPFINPRRQHFVSSHLFSFKRRLFDAIVPADLQDDSGQWLRAGVDVAIAWPILEQTIKRKHIEDILYVYNRANPNSHAAPRSGPSNRQQRLQATANQQATGKMLSRRKGKPLVMDADFLQAHLYELMQAAALSSRIYFQRELQGALRTLKRGQK